MKMKHASETLLVMLLFAAASCGQTITTTHPNATGTVIHGGTAGVPAFGPGAVTWSGGTATTATAVNWDTGAVLTIGSGGGWSEFNEHSTWPEVRPLDNKGPTLREVDYSAAPLEAKVVPSVKYIALAKQIALDSAATDEARILRAIQTDKLKVYDFDKVDNYLYRQALKQGARTRWVWKPMREADQKGITTVVMNSKAGVIYNKLYAQALPRRVLEDVKCVLDEMPDVVFLVSDYEVVRPDPFLAITTKRLLDQGKVWIIDRWDEPGFQDQPVNVIAPADPVAQEIAQK